MAALTMWTVYDHPLDTPDMFVARRWAVTEAGAVPQRLSIVAPTIAPLRALLAAEGLACIPRQDGDDPVIVETWL